VANALNDVTLAEIASAKIILGLEVVNIARWGGGLRAG
jgi:hypothetical protein